MRLDRILKKEDCSLLAVDPGEKMEIFGKEKVVKGKPWSYLRPSDHFGLKIRLTVDQQGKPQKYEKIDKKLKIPGKKFRTTREIAVYRLFSIILIFFIILLFSFKIV